jgi:glucose-1-phosphatase
MKRPALIFDFGNVVAFFDYQNATERLIEHTGLPGQALLERLNKIGFPALLRQYETGKISSEAFSRGFCELIQIDIGHDEFAAAWRDIFWLNESVARLIERLKAAGYTLVLGSNTNDLHATHYRHQFADTLRHFDRLVLSYEVGHIKPSPEFYIACAQAAGAEPSSCVFIDDLPENIAGAEAAGLSGIVYRDTPTLIAELRGLGVEFADRP